MRLQLFRRLKSMFCYSDEELIKIMQKRVEKLSNRIDVVYESRKLRDDVTSALFIILRIVSDINSYYSLFEKRYSAVECPMKLKTITKHLMDLRDTYLSMGEVVDKLSRDAKPMLNNINTLSEKVRGIIGDANPEDPQVIRDVYINHTDQMRKLSVAMHGEGFKLWWLIVKFRRKKFKSLVKQFNQAVWLMKAPVMKEFIDISDNKYLDLITELVDTHKKITDEMNKLNIIKNKI